MLKSLLRFLILFKGPPYTHRGYSKADLTQIDIIQKSTLRMYTLFKSRAYKYEHVDILFGWVLMSGLPGDIGPFNKFIKAVVLCLARVQFCRPRRSDLL